MESRRSASLKVCRVCARSSHKSHPKPTKIRDAEPFYLCLSSSGSTATGAYLLAAGEGERPVTPPTIPARGWLLLFVSAFSSSFATRKCAHNKY
jgi:hypothetical protein